MPYCLTISTVWQHQLSDNIACLTTSPDWQDRLSDNIDHLTTSIMPYTHYPTLRNFKCLQMKKKVHDHIQTQVSKSDGFRSFFHYFWCQNWDPWHKMSRKNSYIYFFYFWSKNKRVWAEKIGKKIPNSKFQKPKSCRQLPYHLIHTSYSIFLDESSK